MVAMPADVGLHHLTWCKGSIGEGVSVFIRRNTTEVFSIEVCAPGEVVGIAVGLSVGTRVGFAVGTLVGEADGDAVGNAVGNLCCRRAVPNFSRTIVTKKHIVERSSAQNRAVSCLVLASIVHLN